jgi:HD superfamily phosphohydrolase YqeK
MSIDFRYSVIVLVAIAGALARPANVRETVSSARASWRDTIRALNEQNFHHSAWGTSHSRRDYEVAKALADSDHLAYDDDVLYAAAYLHDMAGFAPWAKAGVDHQDRGAELMDSVLTGVGFPREKIARVAAAIRTHMPGRDPGTAVESRLLHDADALDWLGAVGIARMMSLVDANGGNPNFASVVGQLRDFLKQVPPALSTEAAKREGVRRAAETRAFLESLDTQTKGLSDL